MSEPSNEFFDALGWHVGQMQTMTAHLPAPERDNCLASVIMELFWLLSPEHRQRMIDRNFLAWLNDTRIEALTDRQAGLRQMFNITDHEKE